MPKVLLTGVIGPRGNIDFDIAGDRLTRDQDIFTLKSHFHYISIHFLAQNLSSPCVVLEHPRLEDFERELEKGYDFVGINFTLVDIAKTVQMCQTVRRLAPDTKIVLGGFGTSCFTSIFRGEEEILKLADHICYGEGVTFLRHLLGEPIDAPIKQVVGPRGASAFPWLNPFPSGSGGFLVSGLGCPNLCEFCSTSAFYGGEYIEMASADRLFEGIKRLWQSRPQGPLGVSILDDNLYKDKTKVARLGQLLREDDELGLDKVSYFAFGTIEDLSDCDVVEDLVLNGAGTIWIGVESLFSKLRKRQGRDVKEVFRDLHAHGITTIGSWIGGWDFHDKKNIEEDLEYFISLEPTQAQLYPLFPPPGTQLWERLASEGRLPDVSLAKRYFGRTSGSEFGFPDWRKNFTEKEISETVESGHGRLYQHAGPSVMRDLRVHLNGYEFCMQSSNPQLREERSELHRAHCVGAYPLIRICEFFAPNTKVRKDIQRLRGDYLRLIGTPTVEQEVMSSYAFLKGCLYKMTTVLGRQPPSEPPFRRYEYDRRPREPREMPYLVEYPHPDERYEREKRVHDNEMKLVRRVIEMLEQDSPREGDEPPTRRIDAMFGRLDAIGELATLVDKLGDDVGLSKGWLRAEVLKSMDSVPAPASAETGEAEIVH